MSFDFNTHKFTCKLKNPKPAGKNQWMACCPCHDDKKQSLAVNYDPEKEKISIYCHAGCNYTDILSSVGCSVYDLYTDDNLMMNVKRYAYNNRLKFVELYDYSKPYNDGLYKIRFLTPNNKKTFRWIYRDPNSRYGYNWKDHKKAGFCPRLFIQGTLSNSMVIIVEGEKDAITVNRVTGYTAVSAENGATKGNGKWKEEYNKQLANKKVYILWDNDETGKTFAENIASQLSNYAESVYMLDLPSAWKECPEKGDITDLYDAVGETETKQILQSLIDNAVVPVEKNLNVFQAVSINPSTVLDTSEGINQIVKNYDDVEIEETKYLYFPWFPRGKLTSIQGDSGSSKSTFLYAVGASVTTGSDILGVPCENPGNVMFITNEDDESDILTSFIDSGGDKEKIFKMEREAIAELDLSTDGAEIISRIIKEYDVKFLVLDPIQAFLRGDMNKANDTRPQLARLMDIAERYDTTIAFIQHTGKDITKGALHRGVGSVDIGAATRSMLQIVSDPENDSQKIAYTVKNNTADIREVRKAIRYIVNDHPESYDKDTGKHRHFHGHAEFIGIIPDYSEKAYKKSLQKAQAEEDSKVQTETSYQNDPLVLTVRKLVSYNPTGIFIGFDDLIEKITDFCGYCPYDRNKSHLTGINHRIAFIRQMMIDKDAIQMDLRENAVVPKAYHWKKGIITPENRKIRGVAITPIKNGKDGIQQTEI